MFRRVLRLYLTEMAKTWRTKFPWLGLAASALMALVARQSVMEGGAPGQMTAAVYFTTSMNVAATVIVPVFSVIFGAMLVAGESTRGTVRTLLVRPITRWDFLTSKLLMGATYTVLLLAVNALAALPIAWGYPLKTAFDESVQIPGAMEQVRLFLSAMSLSLLPQLATMCFGFCISVLSANVATSVGVAAGMWLTLQPVKEFIRFGRFELADWLFLNYYDAAMKVANDKAGGMYEMFNQHSIHMLAGTSIVAIVTFIALSYFVFIRRDLN